MLDKPVQAPGSAPDPLALAQAVARGMLEKERAAQGLGVEILDVQAGRATLSMRVRADMTNGHQTCHGGYIFALADTAFAYACNSYNLKTVAAACSVDFLAPALEGDVLVAQAQEQTLSGRTGIYDVRVHMGEKTIALFRGKSHRIGGDVIER